MNNLFARNDATTVNGNSLNGRVADIHQTVRGSDFYFAICAVMGFVALTVIGLSFLKPRTDRIFFYITAAINMTACIAYFTMGSNLGWAPIPVEFQRTNPVVAGTVRQVYYARYVDWVVTTPLLLMDLLLTAALPWPTIIWVIFLDWIMIITGLIGALVVSRYKFGFFAFGCVAMLGVFYELAIIGRSHAKALGADVHRVYVACGVLTLFIWLLYPIAWGVAEGGNVISPDSEAVFYGVLDFCAKPVFSAALIAGHWKIDPARLGLQIREFGATTPEASRGEKSQNAHTVKPSTAAPQFNATGTSTTGDNHAAHRTGYTPAHENVTQEGNHLNV